MASQTISLFGSSLVQYAITWYITLKTQSGTMMTVSILCGFLPTLLISPLAGVWADRYNRKILIAASDSFTALATLALVILFMMGNRSLWLLFVVSALRSLGAGVQTPAVRAFLPQITPREQLTRVNAANATATATISLLSPMLSAALLAVASIESIFFIDVITAAIAVPIMVFLLKVPAHAKAQTASVTSYFADMREGVRYIWERPYLKKCFILFAYFFFCITPWAFLSSVQVTRAFGNDVWHLSTMEIIYSSGLILGGVLIGWWGGFRNRIHTMAMADIVMGACLVALGLVTNFYVFLVFVAVSGICSPVFNTPNHVILQERIGGDYLGRVFSVQSMLYSSMMPLGMLFFGPLADVIKIEWMYIASGFFVALQGVFFLWDKDLYAAGIPVSMEEAASPEGTATEAL